MYCLCHRLFKEKFACAGLRQYLQTHKSSAPAYPSKISKPISKLSKFSTHSIYMIKNNCKGFRQPVCEQVTSTREYILAESPYLFPLPHLEKSLFLPLIFHPKIPEDEFTATVCFRGRGFQADTHH